MDVSRGTDGRPLDEDLDIGKGFVCRSVYDGAHDTSLCRGVLRRGLPEDAKEERQEQSHTAKDTLHNDEKLEYECANRQRIRCTTSLYLTHRVGAMKGLHTGER